MTTTRHPNPAASCCDFDRSRRNFLRNLGLLAGVGVITSTTGASFMQAAFASTGAASNVLLVLSLRGGADGLSLVVPHGDIAYAAARPKLAVPSSTLLARDAMFGLHPKFAPLMPMWTAGSFAAVNAVGLAAPNRSHFAAMEEIEDADPGSVERRGWLNRLVGLDQVESPVEAAQIGSAIVPTSLYGASPVLAMADIDDMSLPGRDSSTGHARRVASLTEAWAEDSTSLGRGARAALDMSDVFADVAGQPSEPFNGAVYPGGDLGKSLGDAARLVRADIGAEVITVDAGAWDMHVGVGGVDAGLLTTAVEELALALNAFFTDLGSLGSRVTVVTISEFGRRVAENANNGLDHGWGNVMLLLGAGVRGGRYHGTWPGLGDGKLVDGDLAVTNDYRSVLAEVVRTRFGADVSKVF
ncbi:MAG: DUF1501 domain-containing protein, partial [Actinomycetota bacterium]|nr:DUF1501 domain-containing protein [Actinomycetota bacterium]